MILYYNDSGKLTTIIPHGDMPRQGGDLKIYILFDKNTALINQGRNVYIRYKLPNENSFSSDIAQDDKTVSTFHKIGEENIGALIDGKEYLMFTFDLSDNQYVLSRPGTLEVTPKIIGSSGATINFEQVLGTAKIFVENTLGLSPYDGIGMSYSEYQALMGAVNQLQNTINSISELAEAIHGIIDVDNSKVEANSGEFVDLEATNGEITNLGSTNIVTESLNSKLIQLKNDLNQLIFEIKKTNVQDSNDILLRSVLAKLLISSKNDIVLTSAEGEGYSSKLIVSANGLEWLEKISTENSFNSRLSVTKNGILFNGIQIADINYHDNTKVDKTYSGNSRSNVISNDADGVELKSEKQNKSGIKIDDSNVKITSHNSDSTAYSEIVETKDGIVFKNFKNAQTVTYNFFETIADIYNQLSLIPRFSIEIVSELPTENINPAAFYLVRTGDDENNIYTEYFYKNGSWEQVGEQRLSLANYYTKGEVNSLFSGLSVVTAMIVDDAVTTAKIVSSAITTAKIADGAVTTDKIGAKAVTTDKINDEAVTTGKISDGAVNAAKIGTKAVTEDKIDDEAVTSGKIGAKAVTTGKINDGAVTEAKLADDAVSTNKIADGAVNSDKIGAGAVTEGKINGGAVTADKLGTSAVTTGKINDGAVTADKLGSGAVTEGKIANNAVTTDKINNGAVNTNKILDGAVTEDKLGSGAVTANKIGTGAVGTAKLADGAVTGDKIANGEITLAKLAVAVQNLINRLNANVDLTEPTGLYLTAADIDAVMLKKNGEEVATLADLVGIPRFGLLLVDILPASGQADKIYLVRNEENAEVNLYTEYIYYNNRWEILGSNRIDNNELLVLSRTEFENIRNNYTTYNITKAQVSQIFLDTENSLYFTVSFLPLNGTTISSQEVFKDDKAVEPATPDKANYIFMGWYDGSDLFDFNTDIEQEYELYARWEHEATSDISYELDSITETYYVSNYSGSDTVLYVPSTYEDADVKSVNVSNNSTIEKIIVPDALTYFKFENCSALTSVVCGPNTTFVESGSGCSSLVGIYFNGTGNEFIDCFTNVKSPMQYASNLYVINPNGGIELAGNKYSLLTNLEVSGKTSLTGYELSYLKNITNLVIPNTVTSITGHLYDLFSLVSLSIPFIGKANGSETANLCNLAYLLQCENGTSSNTIELTALNGVADSTVNVPKTLKIVNITNAQYINARAFYGYSTIEEINITGPTLSIASNVFTNCTGLERVSLSSSVTSIAANTFDGCTSLTSLTINATVPPTLSGALMDENDMDENFAIYVPADSVDAYKSAENWSDYADKITAMVEE